MERTLSDRIDDMEKELTNSVGMLSELSGLITLLAHLATLEDSIEPKDSIRLLRLIVMEKKITDFINDLKVLDKPEYLEAAVDGMAKDILNNKDFMKKLEEHDPNMAAKFKKRTEDNG